ncbi:BRCT domain-containing protein [Forsythia ovata]|uniref:BRCT domain-containing protein n=1 Tax=Forsythia ovata TaxID=205694 RepID=A0ABD1VF39_9LAMI
MEAEAKDSDEETEDVATMKGVERRVASAQNTRTEMKSPYQSSVKQEILRNSLNLSASKSLKNIGNGNEVLSTLGKETNLDQLSFLKETHNKHLEMLGSCSARSPGKMSSDVPLGTRFLEKVENDLVSSSKSGKSSPNTDVSKLSEKSYSRKTPGRPSLPLCSERIESNAGNTSTSNADELRVTGGFNISYLEKHRDGADFDRVKTPSKRPALHLDREQTTTLPEKRKMTVSDGNSKSLKMSHDPKIIVGCDSLAKRTEGSASESLVGNSRALAVPISPVHYLGEEADLDPVEAVNISRTVISGARQECSEVPQHSCKGLEMRGLSFNLDAKDLCSSRTKSSKDEVEMQQSNLQNIKPSSSGANVSEGEKINGQVDLNLPKVGHTVPRSKSLGRKMLTKKTLDSRSSISKGNTIKPKGSISLHKFVLPNDSATYSIGAVAKEGYEKVASTEKVQMACTDKDGLVDDETEAPEDNEEHEFDVSGNKQKSTGVEAPHSENMCANKRVDVNDTAKRADGNVKNVKRKDAKSRPNENGTEVNKAVCSKKTGLSKSRPVEDARERKVTKGKKHSVTKTKTKAFLMTEKLENPREDAQKDGSNTKQDEEKTRADEKDAISLGDKTKARPSKKLKRSINVEKENELITVGGQNVSTDKKAAGKLELESSKKPLKSGMNIADSDSVKGVQIGKVNSEPACFILSGHKLQRKEFQQVIRHLKGRVCRDSHQWSYQATHFIVPDPIRRTEKFFAAAASGSWILKTDYLIASNEAGGFLAEEPYEWYKKCLSEDGAINLEAPRKWRVLRERTGHGAFYGMRIIIYGECIAPPLDTLKRVVKAGDGTILATSPPYTRFLQSRVDFAIVSPGMPRVDMWVQEFLRHEIPCVVADYLVEYVTKPGYSLERHVQYNTHAWAEKSLRDLINRAEEVVEDVRTPEDDDLACTLCGSCDRGDEMLICGDDTGSAGCGIGTHIDCCDPPLEDVPEEDWFCPACSKKRESTSIRKSPRKRASKSKK